MIEVDNLNSFLDLMDFSVPNTFYYLQIIQRGKDGVSEFAGKNNKHRMLRAYSIFSKEDLINKFDKIKQICFDNNARAYIHSNSRDSLEVTIAMIKKAADLIQSNNTKAAYNSWDTCCGKCKNSKGKKFFLIDIDSKDEALISKYLDIYMDTRGSEKECHLMQTVNGVHLIVSSFDVKLFTQKCIIAGLPIVDIHKDSPTLLYYKK